MDAFSIIGFVFGLMGIVAYTRVDKLEKKLKEKGLLDEDFNSET